MKNIKTLFNKVNSFLTTRVLVLLLFIFNIFVYVDLESKVQEAIDEAEDAYYAARDAEDAAEEAADYAEEAANYAEDAEWYAWKIYNYIFK